MAVNQSTTSTSSQQAADVVSAPVNLLVNSNAVEKSKQAYILRTEYMLSMRNPVPGLYILPSTLSLYTWFGVLCIRRGLYQGYHIRFTLHIPTTFPDSSCPEIYLATPFVFHPLVDPNTGFVSLKLGFPKWSPDVTHIWQLLHYFRRMFIKIDTSAPVDFEAAHLYVDNKDGYCARVADGLVTNATEVPECPLPDDISAQLWDFSSIDNVLEEEEDYIELKNGMVDDSECKQYLDLWSLSSWKRSAVYGSEDPLDVKGYSWMKRDTMQILSPPDLYTTTSV